ncbi:MAG: 3-isopropylmalate dehydratase small subunit [Acidobacteria bacterium]|nr:MAG: 3-isopropylmalate dehydratase small subunit [Acidobacteriota bacterium]
MKAIRRVEGTMAPMPQADIDTDQIIPKQFLKRIERSGFGPFAFYDWARTDDGQLSSDFVLNRPEYQGSQVLVTGPNFGCGSSREHAPWALQDRGFDAIIAPSFADIFRNNCGKIGLVCVTLGQDEVSELIDISTSTPSAQVTVDLEELTVTCGDFYATFEFDEFARECLLNGWDEIALTEHLDEEISGYEKRRRGYLPSAKAV